MQVQAPEEAGKADHLGNDEIKATQVKECFVAGKGAERQGHLHHRWGKHALHFRLAHSKSGKELYTQSLRQVDRENHPSAAFTRPVKYRVKPATRKVQVVVLSLHSVPKSNVASDAVWSHLIRRKHDECQSKLFHPQMGWVFNRVSQQQACMECTDGGWGSTQWRW